MSAGLGPIAVLDMKRRLAALREAGHTEKDIVDTLYARCRRGHVEGHTYEYVDPVEDVEELERQANATGDQPQRLSELKVC